MRKRQVVLELDMETWEAAVEAYGLEKGSSVIPTREEWRGNQAGVRCVFFSRLAVSLRRRRG